MARAFALRGHGIGRFRVAFAPLCCAMALWTAPVWAQTTISDAELSFEVMEIGASLLRIDEASSGMLETARGDCDAQRSQPSHLVVCNERRQLALAASHLYQDHLNAAMDRLLLLQQGIERSLNSSQEDVGQSLMQARTSVWRLHNVMQAYSLKDEPLKERLERARLAGEH